MVKIIHILCFLLLFPMSVWAQETVLVFKGAVTDVNGKGIANVLCKALNAKDSLLAYSISRSDGQYTLKYKKLMLYASNESLAFNALHNTLAMHLPLASVTAPLKTRTVSCAHTDIGNRNCF